MRVSGLLPFAIKGTRPNRPQYQRNADVQVNVIRSTMRSHAQGKIEGMTHSAGGNVTCLEAHIQFR